MFICNFSVNKNKFMKIFKVVIVILAVSILILSIYTIFKDSRKTINEDNSPSNLIILDSHNYTNFLKESHEDINRYIGTEIEVTGYVYRMQDFSDNQFVLARTMLINSNTQAVVVGILCECPDAKKYEDYTWITIKGKVQKGDYHGEIPVLEVTEIKEATIPEDEFVSEPVD